MQGWAAMHDLSLFRYVLCVHKAGLWQEMMCQDRCKGTVIVLTDVADCAYPAAMSMQDNAKTCSSHLMTSWHRPKQLPHAPRHPSCKRQGLP